MKYFVKNLILATSVLFFSLGPMRTIAVQAATTPSLGTAATFGILSSTFTRNVGLTAVGGDLGYTTLSGGGTNSLTGTLHVPSPAQAGSDQNAALANLNGQECTFTFVSGAIDLAADTTHGPIGVYTSGVYCVTGAMSVGTAGISLNGTGTYIFRSTGAFTTVDHSVVALGGASACDLFWTPVATTLGANTTFLGTVIDNSGITVGNLTSWIGRALDFATTVTTDTNSITVPSCGTPEPTSLHVIKSVDNTGGGTAVPSTFSIHVKTAGSDVAGSPQNGTTTPGTTYLLSVGTYTVSEVSNSSYTPSFSGACDSSGNVILTASSSTTCMVTNTYIVPTSTSTSTSTPAILRVIKSVVNTGGGSATSSDFMLYVKKSGSNVAGTPQSGTSSPGTPYALITGTYTVSETASSSYSASFSGDCDSVGNVTLAGVDKTCTITNTYIVQASTSTSTSTPMPILVVSSFVGGGSGGSTIYGCKDPAALNYNYFSASNPSLCKYTVTTSPVVSLIMVYAPLATTSMPKFPNTGFPPRNDYSLLAVVITSGLLLVSSLVYVLGSHAKKL